jgi:hypothetical protein
MTIKQLSALDSFQPVRSAFWSFALKNTPLLAALSYVPVGLYHHDPMLASVGLAMGIYALAFNHASAHVSDALGVLWEREWFDRDQEYSKIEKTLGKHRIDEANYETYIKKIDHTLNSRMQWIFALLGGLLMFLKYVIAYYRDSHGWYGLLAFAKFLNDHYVSGLPFTGDFHEKSPSAVLLAIEPILGFLLGLIAWRMFVLGVSVWRLGSQYALSMNILHPDRCGGLAGIGNMCLWNAFALAGPGLYCGFWIEFGSTFGYGDKWNEYLWGIMAVLAFLACGSFFLPLWGIHKQMLQKRNELFRDWEKVHPGINELMRSLIPKESKLTLDESSDIAKQLKQLEELSAYYQKMPLWPFNAEIISKLALSQVGAVIAFVGKLLKP